MFKGIRGGVFFFVLVAVFFAAFASQVERKAEVQTSGETDEELLRQPIFSAAAYASRS